MLQIKNIVKTYVTGDLTQTALKNVSINFRENEFVSILGQSGSGKTTLLNIIGGLDHYDSGDLIINGKSTKKYKDSDWDTYRNHSIGFIFQSYNLIPHQSVLSNVELALTLAGISKKERRERALQVLDKVGLKEQSHKKPNQMSGGQMQRVAIARALINNPDILLADEPTGALDSETSIQIMELLKEIAKDKLVIMVTHNPELAKAYSTRIVRLLDGVIVDDSKPFVDVKEETSLSAKKNKVKMSFATALSLSFHNLLTKKGRTLLTSFAGSIGIIGISLILALSTGFQNYVNQIQEDTLTSYPLTIAAETGDPASAILSMHSSDDNGAAENEVKERKYIESMFSTIGSNDIRSFHEYLQENKSTLDQAVSLIQYKYSVSPNIYTKNETGIVQVNPNTVFSSLMGDSSSSMTSSMMSVFNELMDDQNALDEQYKVLAGRWPQEYNELVLILPKENEISDMLIYSLGLRDSKELSDMIMKLAANETITTSSEPQTYTYEDLMSIPYKLIDPTSTYRYNEKYNVYESMSEDQSYMEELYENSVDLNIVGVVCANEESMSSGLSSGIGYTKELTEHIIEQASQSEIVKKQLENPEVDVFSNKRFDDDSKSAGLDFQDMISIDQELLSSAFGMNVSEEDLSSMTQGYMQEISSAITTDTTKAQGQLIEHLGSFTNGILTTYVQNYQDALTHTAILNSKDVDGIVQEYLQTEEVANQLAQLETEYTIPKDVFASMYQQTIATFMKGYIQLTSTDKENPSTLINEAMISPLVTQMTTQDAIVSATSQMASKMTEATMQKTILGKVGELTGNLTKTLATSFHVDQEKIAKAFSFDLSEEELTRLMQTMSSSNVEKTAETNVRMLGYQELDEPTSINFYFKDFESKEFFLDFLDDYNKQMLDVDEEKVINYTDLTGILTSSVKLIVDSVSYVLIAFVSISLIVSSIMIGIITYISVLERTKEIGILRAIGASKRNISSIFNAETFIVGLCAGLMGIGITLALIPPINHIIHSVTNNMAINAVLPWKAAIVLVTLSVVLTLISGLIPAKQASKKDPVTALRSE